jgi:hypothetical protein
VNRTSVSDSVIQLADLPVFEDGHSLGADIDAANAVLLDPEASRPDKEQALLKWLGRSQPCLFGRLAARDGAGPGASKGLGFFVCWLDEADLAAGADHVAQVIAQARRSWKDAAWRGRALAFLIVFNSGFLARARPSAQLLAAARSLASLYLVEHAPLDQDTIYTEAVPLRMTDGTTQLFKSTVQTFYSGAHGTRSHDRRVPGGLVLSMVAPGHYAHCLVAQGLYPDLTAAAEFVRQTAYRSIGKGGIGHPQRASSSWHNRVSEPAGNCPSDVDPNSYSATYQTDVTLPSSLATHVGPSCDPAADGEVWAALGLEYLSGRQVPPDHVNHGWFTGILVDDEERFGNPWPPQRAVNSAQFRRHY